MVIKKAPFCFIILMLCFSSSRSMERPKTKLQQPKIKCCITFTKDDDQPGRYQDLKTLTQLEIMAQESFISLQKKGHMQLNDAFKKLTEAKEHTNNPDEIVIEKEVIKDLLSFILIDGGKIEFWRFPDGRIADLNVKLIDSREACIFIEGPILDIARTAKFVTQKPDVKQTPKETESTSWWWDILKKYLK